VLTPEPGWSTALERTAANVHDLESVPKLIRPDDDVVNGDAGYTGIEEREKIKNDGRLPGGVP
jgi:IS5 family transposase